MTKFRGPVGRIRSLMHCLNTLERWTFKSRTNIKDDNYKVTIQPKYEWLLEAVERLPNVKTSIMEPEKIVDKYANDIGAIVSQAD